MAKKKTKQEEEVSEVVEIIVEPVSPSGSVTVFDAMTKARIRTYSAAEHGPDYRKLAMQFATKKKGVVL